MDGGLASPGPCPAVAKAGTPGVSGDSGKSPLATGIPTVPGAAQPRQGPPAAWAQVPCPLVVRRIFTVVSGAWPGQGVPVRTGRTME